MLAVAAARGIHLSSRSKGFLYNLEMAWHTSELILLFIMFNVATVIQLSPHHESEDRLGEFLLVNSREAVRLMSNRCPMLSFYGSKLPSPVGP
jgi:hypothetical protein